MSGKCGARLLERFQLDPSIGFDRHAFGCEAAVPVGGPEGAVRHPLLVEALWHEDGETWRRLHCVFLERVACENRSQVFYLVRTDCCGGTTTTWTSSAAFQQRTTPMTTRSLAGSAFRPCAAPSGACRMT